MAAMLDLAKMAAPSCARQKCKPYDIVDLWAKFGAFGRIWTNQSLYCPNTPIWRGLNREDTDICTLTITKNLRSRKHIIPHLH